MTLNAAERRVLRAALREFAASHESEFSKLREYHEFLRPADAQVSVIDLARKLGVRLERER
jgi:hypothetical protein